MKKKPDDLSNVRIKIWPLNSRKKSEFIKNGLNKKIGMHYKPRGESYICKENE